MGSTTKTGITPSEETASEVDIQDIGTKTSSPSLTPSAFNKISMESDPLPQAIQC